MNVMLIEKAGGTIQEKLVGINDASTFSGFCGVHDDSTFGPIEKQAFSVSRETVFLCGYRGLCRELYLKRAALEVYDLMRELDRGKPIEFQRALQQQIQGSEDAARASIRDIERHKRVADEVLLASSVDRVRYYALEFEREPDLATAGAWVPDEDFSGSRLQNLGDLDAHLQILSFSVFATPTGGIAVFVWTDDQKACTGFVESIDSLPDEELADAVVRLSTVGENTYFRPDWWEGLHEAQQRAIRRRWLEAASPFMDWPSLAKNAMRYADWGTVRRFKDLG